MSLLVAKKYWDKFKVWCLYHWKWLVLILAFAVTFLLGRKSNKKLLKQAKGALESQKLQSKAIERSHSLEIKKREKARKKYESALERIDREHSKGEQKIDEARKLQQEAPGAIKEQKKNMEIKGILNIKK